MRCRVRPPSRPGRTANRDLDAASGLLRVRSVTPGAADWTRGCARSVRAVAARSIITVDGLDRAGGDARTVTVAIGTSGYNYPEWRGTFYPDKFATPKMLPYYPERFSTVEINSSFYRMPNAKPAAGWDADTPAHFRFALKAPQRITHYARLREIDEPLAYFIDIARRLGPK